MRRSQTVVLMSVLFLAIGSKGALAQSPITATFPIKATVGSGSARVGKASLVGPAVAVGGCYVSTIGINFGNVRAAVVGKNLKKPPYSANGAIVIACGTGGPTSGSSIVIALDNGANGPVVPTLNLAPNSTAIRAMTNGRSFMAYDLFKPSLALATLMNGSSSCSKSPQADLGELFEWGVGGSPSGALSCGVDGFSPCCTVDEGGADTSFILPPLGMALLTPGAGLFGIPVQGSIPADQVQQLLRGTYTDSVTVTVTFQ